MEIPEISVANVALADLAFTIFSVANCIEFLAEEWLLSDAVCRIQGDLSMTFIDSKAFDNSKIKMIKD